MPKPKKEGESKLRLVPSVDQLLRTDSAKALRESIGIRRLTAIARLAAAEIRSLVLAEQNEASVTGNHTAAVLLAEAVRLMENTSKSDNLSGIKHVINATGVVLHTNLGRAPLSKAACEAMTVEASRYCTLEYDSVTGTRGRRAARVEFLLKELLLTIAPQPLCSFFQSWPAMAKRSFLAASWWKLGVISVFLTLWQTPEPE
jgi:L-seryl-tRNA(Ser) seleniumtransferase